MKTGDIPKPLSIKANMLWNSFGSMFNLACLWLITVFIVRLAHNYEAAGVYALAMSIYSIFAPVAQFRTYVYQISDLHDENSTGEYLAFRFITCAIALLLTMGFTVATGQGEYLFVVFAFALFKIAYLITDVFHAVMQKHKRMDYLGTSDALQGIVALGIFVLVFSVSGNLVLTLFSMFLATLLVALFYDYPRARRFGEVHLHISKKKVCYLFLRVGPLVIAAIAAAAAPSLPRQALNYLEGPEALGVYGTLAAPIALIQTGASYIYNPLLTYFCSAFEKKDKSEFNRLLKLTIIGIVCIGIICSIGLLFVGRVVLAWVYGSDILDYFYLMQPLVLCAVITGFMWFLNDLAQALRDFSATVWGNIVALVLSVSFMIPLIIAFGLNGVTYTNILTAVCAIAFMAIKMKKRFRRNFQNG